MSQPSNSNLIGPGQITLTPDYQRHSMMLGVHFVTISLQPREAHELILQLFRLGQGVYGGEWSTQIYKELGSQHLDNQVELLFLPAIVDGGIYDE